MVTMSPNKVLIAVISLVAVALATSNCTVEVKFRLFANQDPVQSISINETNYSSFGYNPTFKYIILCHGWMTPDDVDWYRETIHAFMTMPNYVVIGAYYQDAVDNEFYLPAAENVPIIGEIIGNFIIGLKQIKNVPLEQIELVGHSLGAHIAGDAGNWVYKTLGSRVHRIFGLDPAAPGFFVVERRLQLRDARIVIVFHTSFLGMQFPLGNLDFFPNGGWTQGKCGTAHISDHTVATYYFYCSVDYQCTYTYTDLNISATNDPVARMSYWVPDTATYGKYFMKVIC